MRDLLAQVYDKEEADSLMAALEDAKLKAKETQPSGRQNLLYTVAVEKEKDAADAYNKNDFSGAKTLYKVIHIALVLSMSCDDDEDCIEDLEDSIEDLREEAEDVNASKLAPWYYERARKDEQEAIDLLDKDDFRGAAEYFIQAAFLYEIAREKAESIQ